LFHFGNPIVHFVRTKLGEKAAGFPVLMSKLFPGYIQFNGLSERESFPATQASEKPPATAPGAVHLRRKTDATIIAVAMAHQIVICFLQVDNSHGVMDELFVIRSN
jgi:hypothetical protein